MADIVADRSVCSKHFNLLIVVLAISLGFNPRRFSSAVEGSSMVEKWLNLELLWKSVVRSLTGK
jgi:hypothetical protein